MAFSLSRLRLWIVALALLTAAVVAGFYLRARRELREAERNLPSKVGLDIQQTSEGFTLSKSEGGRTLFTIHASKATQFKQGGRAELHDVSITVYGAQSDRYDRISGTDFTYDPHAGTVVSRGVVQIDLAGGGGASPAEPAAPASPPGKRLKIGRLVTPPMPKEPIQVRLQGLSFNQKTGMAESDGLVEFRVAQVAGTARGLAYDSHKHALTLRSAVDIRTAGRLAARLQARSGRITKQPRQLTLRDAELTKEGGSLQTDEAVVHLAEDNAIERVDALGNVRFRGAGEGLRLHAARGQLRLGARNRVESAWFGGGVDFESPRQAASGSAGQMQLQFSGEARPHARQPELIPTEPAQLQTIYASRGVVLHQAPQAGSRNRQALTITSAAMTFALKGGRQLSSAQTDGPGELTIEGKDAKGGAAQTRIEARRFTADFGEQQRLRTLRAAGGVVVTSRSSGEPDKVSRSQSMLAEFNAAGELRRVVQEGNFHYHEAQSSASEPGGRSVTAARASYSVPDETLSFTGSPRIVDGGMTVTADRIRLQRQSGELSALGQVKTSYSQLKAQPDGALLAASDPVHVTAQAMTAGQKSGVAHYSGGARLWQGANIVEAETIDFDRHARTILAQGDAAHPVRSVFVRVDPKGKATTVLVTAPRLRYADHRREAIFSGGVRAKGADGVLTAERAEVYLSAAGAMAGEGPSRLERIVASGQVVVQQQQRRVQGERLEYEASSGAYVMTGGEPTLTDPEHGTVRADSLTFYSHDDRVVAEGGDASRAVTHTQISR